MDTKKNYEYSSKWFILILGFIMFTGTTFLFYYKAINNNSGLLINNIIELNKGNANKFYWILFALSLIMTLMAVVGAYFKVKEKNYIVIDDYKIIIPPSGFQRKSTEILFANLLEVNEAKVNGTYILTLYSKNKKRSIAGSLLSKKEYQEIKSLVTQQISNP